MIHFKNHNNGDGFTFIEIVLAVLMLGIMLTSALGLQNSSFTSIVKYSERLRAVLLLKNVLFDASYARAQNKGYAQEEKKVSEIIETTLRYSTQKVPQNSALAPFADVIIEKAEATWSGILQENKETLITFLYQPEKKEKEKA
jgi:Tfp pilus assembly protein PilV